MSATTQRVIRLYSVPEADFEVRELPHFESGDMSEMTSATLCLV